MTSRFSKKSPVDSIIIDMIIDHYNKQSFSGQKINHWTLILDGHTNIELYQKGYN